MPEYCVVTGAFSYTGKYITRWLLSMGKTVRTLTGHPNRPNPFGDQVSIARLDFDDPAELTKSLRGATTLYNTYWVRFPYRRATFDRAVQNTKELMRAAREAGIRRVVHISVTKPSSQSSLPYYRGKAAAEQAIGDSGLSYAIIRPTLIFGAEDILINNIAWLLRHFPIFVMPGGGEYRVQPVFVEDVAEIAVRAGDSNDNLIGEAAGPEVYTFDELVRLIASQVQSKARIVHAGPQVALVLCRLVGYAVHDVVLTREELAGLMANLLVADGPPTGQTRLSDWLAQNASTVGTSYASELERHFR